MNKIQKKKINDEDVKLKKNEYDRQYRLRNKEQNE
jgi:hypothetical protein